MTNEDRTEAARAEHDRLAIQASPSRYSDARAEYYHSLLLSEDATPEASFYYHDQELYQLATDSDDSFIWADGEGSLPMPSLVYLSITISTQGPYVELFSPDSILATALRSLIGVAELPSSPEVA